MRPEHFLCLVLTPVAQAMLLFGATPDAPGLPASIPFLVLALMVPFGCYLWGLHNAPLAPKTSRALRLLLLGLVALALTMGGFLYGLQIITAHMI